MDFFGPTHVFETLPPYMGNRELPTEKQLVIGLRAVSTPRINQYGAELKYLTATYALEKATELGQELSEKLIEEHFAFIKGLVIDGKEITGFREFWDLAPRELTAWVENSIRIYQVLSQADRKNYLPESVTD